MSKSNAKGQRRLSVIVMFVVIILGLFLLLINFITDWLWFKEMGYVSVFFTQLFTELKVGIPIFVVLTVGVYLYLKLLKKGYFAKIASHEATDMKKLNRYTVIISLLFGLVTAFYAVTNLWFEILQFANATDFDIKDPIFHFDISFYIFKLDFLKQLNEMLIGIVLLFIVVTVIYYAILLTMHSPDIFEQDDEPAGPAYDDGEDRYTGGGNPFEGMGGNSPFDKIFEAFGRKGPQPKPQKRQLDDNNFKQLMHIASGQLSFLGIVFFVMIAINFFLKQFDLLHTHTGAVYGAGFTDVNVTLWVYRVLAVLALIGAVTVTHHIRKKQIKKILTIPVIMIIIGAIGIGAGYLIQSYIVSPDEINKEGQYLERNIEYTQYAYQLNDVEEKSFAADNKLTSKDIINNPETISNIRINDYQPVNTFYNQTQSIRQYYRFNDVDVDRYMVNGELTQTYLATREIDEKEINQTWLNRHLKYTHGYGITLSRVDAVTTSGQPDVLIKNIPPESTVDEINVDRPEIYFGELSNDYILVNTSEDEFDYPEGSSNKYTQYEGNAGIKLNFFNRVLFAIREQSMKILVSSNIKSDSKIIINRNVVDRVRKIMPSLSYENDPYTVVVDGRIYWMMDAYTTSSYYPYSEPYDAKLGINYIRNSVKVVVDAYNGDTSFYVVDENDPIAMTYQKIYPKLFKSMDQMPEGLQSHIRYPNTLFQIQASVYTRYHMEDVKVFYQNEDVWDIANEIYGKDQQVMEPNYFVVKLPGEKDAEFINSIPYTPKSKQNMTALMVARNDGKNYGQLILYRFPKSKTIYGPMQIEAQINQNPEISSDFTLWSSKGSSYKRGNLFVIPIETSLLYVEPVYLEAENSAIPEVKRVIVAFDDKIAYEPTLGEALNVLFGDGTSEEENQPQGSGSNNNTETKADLIKKAVKAYEDAQGALKNGDWSKYGEYMKELENALKKLS
ncbi:UPF0182 family protein [Ihubacter sp. rT4E-8]|uniref:UPF0182 family membrane protein n=1 Tax=unclassified Ihubacter TaxID=2633299 RepID=UPI003C7E47EA